MRKAMSAGLAAVAILVGGALAGPALADGPLHVTTDFPSPVFSGDPFKDDLASIGVGVELANPVQIDVYAPTKLTFRLLASLPADRGGLQIDTLVVDGVDYVFGTQAFSPAGTLLGSQIFSGGFTSLVGFRTTDMPDDEMFSFLDGAYAYIRSVDEPNLTGIGPFIGGFNTLYFSLGEQALIEVTAGGVPEPQAWLLMIGGFALAGGALRRRRTAMS